MATGHILPGYGDPVSRLKRAQMTGLPIYTSKLAEMEGNYKLGDTEFDRIRAQSRHIWSRCDREPTTYHFFHSGQELPPEERTRSRPTSPTRKNKPHPPQVFLTNRLHYIEGYHNPDTTVGKPCYRIDASLQPDEHQQRLSLRQKYVANRPRTSLINLYKQSQGLPDGLTPYYSQAAQAWLKIADDKDQGGVREALQRHKEVELLNQSDAHNTEHADPFSAMNRSHTAYPALDRYLKPAGFMERCHVASVLHPPHAVVGTRGQMKSMDIAAARRVRALPCTKRGDFLMHPDWPPTLQHHRVST